MADSNILRIGKISSINYPEGTARISYEDKDGSTTSELPFLAWEYWMPKIGDQVLVGHLSNGSCAGVIIGPVWHGDYQPADGREGVYRKEYSNEPGTANETYDAGAKAYSQTIDGTAEVTATESWTIQVGGCTIQANKDGTMTIMASKKITINAPEVEFLEKVTVKKRPPSKDLAGRKADHHPRWSYCNERCQGWNDQPAAAQAHYAGLDQPDNATNTLKAGGI